MFLAILALIVTLLLVIGIHEAGHAGAAYFFKVKIKAISLGFGKPLFQIQTKNGCAWIWALWPLGGYVHLLNSRITPVEAIDHSLCFDKKAIWKRTIILLAGPLANLVTAVVLFTLVFYMGIQYKIPLIKSIQTRSISSEAGMKAHDQFISIGGYLTPTWQEVNSQLLILWGSKKVQIQLLQADGKLKEVTVNLSQITFHAKSPSLLDALGIKPDLDAKQALLKAHSFLESAYLAYVKIKDLFYFFIIMLKQLFKGLIPFSALLGPVGLFAASIASLQQGIMVFLFFIATFSVAVALVNLFPLPGLDGGSILYGGIEFVRGKPLSVALEILLYRLMFIGFCLFLIQLLLNDWMRFMT